MRRKTFCISTKRTLMTSARLVGFDAPTVWQEFTPLSNRLKSVNLGQGFPDWTAPPFIKKALVNAVLNDNNQYCRSGGEVVLVNALAKHYGPLVGRTIDPLKEVTTSVGATEGIFAIMQAYINKGDEVVILEPAFDIYPAQVQMAGGVTKYVPLRLDSATGIWELNFNELEEAINPRTKILLLNTPHNPTGKVLSEKELYLIRGILLRNPHVICVCDEVYEKLVFDGKKHLRLASLPDMWERTITVSSVGKTFSVTGWKVGWMYGCEAHIYPVMLANQWVQFSVSTPTQVACAAILEEAEAPYEGFESYYEYVRNLYEKKRNYLVSSLKAAHLHPVVPEGGFFVIADTSAHNIIPQKYFDEPSPTGQVPVSRDWAFARYLTTEWGVTPIPPSAFYTKETAPNAANLGTQRNILELTLKPLDFLIPIPDTSIPSARFAFCKTEEALVEADVRLRKLGKSFEK